MSDLELFAPPLAKGPFTAHRLDTAAMQLAAALAQTRAPITRSDDDLRSHASFIRELADRLAPDFASAISSDVGTESANTITTSINTGIGQFSLLRIWLADTVGGAESGTPAASVTFPTGANLQTITLNKSYYVLTPSTGVLTVSVNYAAAKTWYWAIARYGRVYYSTALSFS